MAVMNLRGKIEITEITDTGKVREHNEDAIGSNPDAIVVGKTC